MRQTALVNLILTRDNEFMGSRENQRDNCLTKFCKWLADEGLETTEKSPYKGQKIVEFHDRPSSQRAIDIEEEFLDNKLGI